MRTILLCILISIISHWAWGQEIHHGTLPDSMLVSDGLIYGKPAADTLTATRDGFLTEEEMEMYYWIFNHGGRGFISAWTIYSDECWADSTKHEELRPCFSAVYPPCPGHSYDPPRFYYTHREPTLPGFMEFLERKVKP